MCVCEREREGGCNLGREGVRFSHPLQMLLRAVSGLSYERQRPHDCVSLQLRYIVSQKVLINSFCRSQSPHKSVNLSSMITDIKDTMTDLCGS